MSKKDMKKGLGLLIGLSALLWSCGGGYDQPQNNIPDRKAKGGVVYGNVFKTNEVENFRNLYPLNLTDAVSYRIGSQVYEPLVRRDQKDLSFVPGLAEKWDVNDSATVFTFHLRKGVNFHDDPCFPDGKGRPFTAKDVEYCFTRLCTQTSDNSMYAFVVDRIKGARAYYDASTGGNTPSGKIEGIQVIDDHTVKIELNYPFADFLDIISHNCCWIFPKEAYDKYGVDMRVKMVGTGAFKSKTIKENEAVILERNSDYWRYDEFDNQLPYLDAIKISFLKEKKSELLEFRKGNLDMIFRLPLEMIDDVVGELEEAKAGGNIPFNMQVTPCYNIQYYGFQHKSDIFSNADVRRAFNYALDRDQLVTYTLQGDGTPGKYGIVPYGMKGYANDSLAGYDFDPAKAKEYLAKAGYPNGQGFPEITLQLNSGGATNIQVAEVVQNMLMEHLNVNIKMNVMPMAQHYENLETGKAVFWRAGWNSDYPSPENFLNLLYGKHVPEKLSDRSFLNSVRYQNARFDSVFEAALQTVDKDERYRLYRLADQIQLEDAAIFPLFYEEFTRLLHLYVKNFPQNPMEYRDMAVVYFKEDEK